MTIAERRQRVIISAIRALAAIALSYAADRFRNGAHNLVPHAGRLEHALAQLDELDVMLG